MLGETLASSAWPPVRKRRIDRGFQVVKRANTATALDAILRKDESCLILVLEFPTGSSAIHGTKQVFSVSTQGSPNPHSQGDEPTRRRRSF